MKPIPCRNPTSGKPSIVTQANIEALFDLHEAIDNLRGIASNWNYCVKCGYIYFNHLKGFGVSEGSEGASCLRGSEGASCI